MSSTNQAFLFMCHYTAPDILREFRKITVAAGKTGGAYLLCHVAADKIPSALKKYPHYPFSYESVYALGYPMMGTSIVPGHTHFPVLQFFKDHPGFDHYWLIEYDVRFSGDWSLFFDFFNNRSEDFLTCHIRRHCDEPHWVRWSLSHPTERVALSDRLRSFNPIYRLSKQALAFIHTCLQNGWRGHHEVLLPTLLHHHGFKIIDFGGEGAFVLPGMANKFYTGIRNGRGVLDEGTMRYRPPFWMVGRRKNSLYHPVKPFPRTVHYYIKSCCRRRRPAVNPPVKPIQDD